MASDLQIPELELDDLHVSTRPAAARRSSSEMVEIMTATAGIIALVASDAAPAGLAIADGLYRGLFAALVVWFASRARRWAWACISTIGAIAAASLITQALAVIGMILAVRAFRKGRRSPKIGATIAFLSLPALFTQGVGPLFDLTGGAISDPFGTSALITAVAVGPIFRTGWQTVSRKRRRSIARRLSKLTMAVSALFVASAIVCLLAVPSLVRGLENTQRGAQAASNGNLDVATMRLEQAAQDWSNANRIIAGPWMLPARLLPIAGQNLRAGQVTTGQASALTASAATLTGRVDPTALVADGAVQTGELDRISPAFDALAATVTRAEGRIGEIDTPWLLPPISERMSRANEVLAPSSGLISASAEALHLGRDLLGAAEPRQILVMFTTPSEARGTGGFVGSWALVEASEGQLRIDRSYRSVELNTLLEENEATLNADADYARRYERFDIDSHIQDVTISPHFPSVAAVAADLFEQATEISVDAVISVDPVVLENLIAFTGPIQAGELSLTGANTANELLVEQYVAFEGDESGREAALLALTNQLTTSLFSEPPDPVAFVSELAPLADQDRINLWLANDPDSEVTERLGLSGAFPAAPEDIIAVVHQNSGQNKIDSFLERSLEIVTVLDPASGTVRHDLTINLENTAPPAGLPDAILASNDQGLPLGTNRMILSTYARHAVLDARRDGEPVPVEADTEFGLGVYSVVVDLGPGESTAIDLTLIGEMANDHSYDITLGSQPLVGNEQVEWRLMTADGSRVDGPADWSSGLEGLRWTSAIDRDKALQFTLPR